MRVSARIELHITASRGQPKKEKLGDGEFGDLVAQGDVGADIPSRQRFARAAPDGIASLNSRHRPQSVIPLCSTGLPDKDFGDPGSARHDVPTAEEHAAWAIERKAMVDRVYAVLALTTAAAHRFTSTHNNIDKS